MYNTISLFALDVITMQIEWPRTRVTKLSKLKYYTIISRNMRYFIYSRYIIMFKASIFIDDFTF